MAKFSYNPIHILINLIEGLIIEDKITSPTPPYHDTFIILF